ncbi:hypothetical protein ASPACDRAFT_1888417 [Aspergillus aculeatus ATCC 16872]|uniref:C3H1-type domain-containing protein n=1 Tax=Aspergillus aculeatus (strain ATCC 16872 / CBS 172.66 / WB 5094) TaxID=690307 RepID=A0A1L9WU69_ASPA1|nr:uncharacterized protein ASPACDRAFT_1888417 [Aspergillus aculeatus ATCC 16872]OJJ99745.1 hypothetical protein ASPACDRAFT_1888417 [Aspergillus aculeatus ATCC 16872]
MDTELTSVQCPPQVPLDLLELRKRLGSVMAVDDCKNRLIQDLFFEVETLHSALLNECTKQENERFRLNQEIAQYKTEVADLRHNQAKLSFVSILVDGDCMNFNDALIQEGHNGGRRAARLLLQAVERYIRDTDPQASPSLQYRVSVYANLPGLEKAYREAKVLSWTETLDPFVRGFNMEDSQCDFIDAGNGKECSDVKIRATFERDILDVHCRHIIFCAATDNGYARLLGSHRGSNRITLVEGAPFAWEIEQLATELRTAAFPAVFRAAKLPARAYSFSAAATASANVVAASPPTAGDTQSSSPARRDYATIAKANLQMTPSPSASSSSYSATASTTPTPPTPSPSSSSSTSTSTQIIFNISPSVTSTPLLPKIKYNARGHRIDPQLPRASSKENYERLRAAKLCNRYHLQDDCSYGDSCTHAHGRRLTSAQDLHDLRCISRTSVCGEGLWCTNRKCVCGHQCPWESWRDHELTGCRFPEEMHGVDREVVRVE